MGKLSPLRVNTIFIPQIWDDATESFIDNPNLAEDGKLLGNIKVEVNFLSINGGVKEIGRLPHTFLVNDQRRLGVKTEADLKALENSVLMAEGLQYVKEGEALPWDSEVIASKGFWHCERIHKMRITQGEEKPKTEAVTEQAEVAQAQ